MNKWLLLSTVGEFKIDRLAIYIYNNLTHIEKSCSFTYFYILLSSRQDGGLEEQFNDVILQDLCDNRRPSEDIAELDWLNAMKCGFFKMVWKL
jgi:hypothetical protein